MSERRIKLSMPECDLISSVGFLHQRSVRETYPCHTHDFFEFFYVLKGKAIHHINGQQMILSQGTLVLIRPEDIHKYSFINGYDMELLSIGVTPELMTDACCYMHLPLEDFCASRFPPQCVLTGNEWWTMSELLQQIGEEPPGTDRREYFLSILPSLLYRIHHAEAEHTLLPPWLARTVDKMSLPENFTEGLPRLLEMTHVSQEHINRSFRRYLGMTPTAFINMKRMHYCAELLESGADILDVCYQCGFKHTSHFYQVFRETYHCTPSEFLKNRSTKRNIR